MLGMIERHVLFQFVVAFWRVKKRCGQNTGVDCREALNDVTSVLEVGQNSYIAALMNIQRCEILLYKLLL